MKTKTQQPTADQRYYEHMEAIYDLLAAIRDEIGGHHADLQHSDRANWGYPNELAEVRHQLQQTLNFLTDTEN